MIKENKKFYTARYDRVFKTILCDEDNPYLLQEFLSRLLKKKIEIVEFLRNELPVNNVLEKVKTVDVLVKADGEYIHIEVNIGVPKYLHIRNFIYFSSLYSKKVQRGKKYDSDTKFVHLDFTYGMDKNKEDYIVYYVQSDNGEKYVDNIKIIEYNMDKIMDYWYNDDKKKVREYKHLIMLDLKTEDLEKMSKGDDFVEEVNKKLTELNEQETFQSAMTYEEDQLLILNTEKHISFEEGKDEGKQEGKLEGKQESKIEIAKSMLKDNMNVEIISRYTGLSTQEINTLL